MSHDLIEMRLGVLSERIKRGRDLGGMTLVQLSKKSGVSPSTIQKIENRQMTPSIAVIFKIAVGLGIEPTDLIASAHPSPVEIVMQRAGQQAQMSASDELQFEKLSADIVGTDLECWRVNIAPGYGVRLVRPQKLDEQIVVALKGKFELEIDNEKYQLSAGDTLQCKSKTLYSLRNTGSKPASYIMAGRFPHSVEIGLISNLN